MPFLKQTWSMFAIVSGVFLGQINTAQAVLLDFEGLPTTPLPSSTPVPESVLTDDLISDGVLFGKTGVSAGVAVVENGFGLDPGAGNTVVGLDQFGNIPNIVTGDIFFSFVVPNTLQPGQTDFVSFSIGNGGGDVDVFEIRAFDFNNTLLQTQNFAKEAAFPVSFSLPGINRIEVDFTGEFGYALNDLNFNTPTPATSVPEPQAILGLATVLGMGVLMQRKASKKKQLVKI
ncbi:PEP-CTERM sorting domain-containing protein [Nostoc sp. CENA67]|uniref:PEP-CTERM sorting domain-containing protein n=1 Tax=Amazonocrinis nigriterrae CENA67 TaxID=2794033 RepID=A0A8J7L7C8_9NOST|nr:PEP-CTERM sorting domain-containing protein [Amazonocrinis nigriterrae]MBH8563284.1 PEP-CTERM sorting domain-containing protein [Amazonocrinis nigriterrae CENA67]